MASEIGILGGTGDLGRGLALRWAATHPVRLGSRDAERGRAVAAELAEGRTGLTLSGGGNEEAAACPVVVLALPPDTLAPTLAAVGHLIPEAALVICAVVPMAKVGDIFLHDPGRVAPGVASAAEFVGTALPGRRVVAALHSLPARALARTARAIRADVLVCGDDAGALAEVGALCELIEGVRAMPAGPLAGSGLAEAMVAGLFNAGFRNGVRQPVLVIGDARG